METSCLDLPIVEEATASFAHSTPESPGPGQRSEQEGEDRPNKYLYAEFAGYEGERRLKAILRTILPLALYRTWEILAEHQAPGNDCFLSEKRLAQTAHRCDRTIRLNLHDLQAKRLLALRAERKEFREDERVYSKTVVIKDFGGLYALAHEYYCWMFSADYIEPVREFADLIKQDEHLVKKLLRFNNYRRILLCQVPGPKPMPREEYNWFTSYREDGLTASGSDGLTKRAEDTERKASGTQRKENLHKDVQNHLKKDSQERITTMNQQDSPEGDSFDSEPSLGGEEESLSSRGACSQKRAQEAKCYTKDESSPSPYEISEGESPNQANPFPIASEKMGAKQSTRRERAQAFVQRAKAASEQVKPPSAGQRTPRSPAHALVQAFVAEVSGLFRDQNLKGSTTRALRAIEGSPLTEIGILACLVKAYCVTRDTKRAREHYRRPDGDIKMPLFCTMFARFVQDCTVGKFHYPNEKLAADIAADDRLVLFVVEHRLEAEVLHEAVVVQDQAEAETMSAPVAVLKEDVAHHADLPPVDTEEPVEEAAPAQQEAPPKTEPPTLPATDPALGWTTRQGADAWAYRLRDHLGVEMYNFHVLPTPYGRWGFILFPRKEPEEGLEFFTAEQVKEYL